MREAEEKQEAMTPEEIEEMEKNIPEWKRNALVLQGEEIKEEKGGMFSGLKNRVKDTKFAKEKKDSEANEKIKAMRDDFKDFKEKLRDGVENT